MVVKTVVVKTAVVEVYGAVWAVDISETGLALSLAVCVVFLRSSFPWGGYFEDSDDASIPPGLNGMYVKPVGVLDAY